MFEDMSGNSTANSSISPPSSASFVRWMVAGVALINLSVFALVAFSLHRSYGEFEEHAETTALNLSQMLAVDIAGDIDKIDLALLAAADEIERESAGAGIDRQTLNAFLGRLQGRVPEIISLRTTDANGIVGYGLGADPAARLNNSDREYFVRQRDEPGAGLVVARPVFARIDKQWVIPMSRPIRRADGTFAGVVYANFALGRLSRIFAAIDVGRRGSVSLRDAELRILAYYPLPKDSDRVLGEKLVVPELQEIIRAGRDAGTYVTGNTVDGVERKFAVHKIPAYPLYAVAGRATDEYMVAWRDQALKTAALAALFFLTTLVSSWLIYGGWRRQVAAAEELAREEEKFHTVADYTYDWEYWEGPAHELLFMSPSCERVTGYSQAEFAADPELAYRIILPDDVHLMAAHRSGVAHEDAATLDFRIVRRDGEIRWIAHGCRSVYGHEGQFMGRRISNRDVTERKQAEAALQGLNVELEQRVARRTAQLEAANKELEEFSYSMSHDLRAPLRAILGFSQILIDERAAGLDSEGRRLLEVVRTNTLRMSKLVDELLEFLRLGRRPLEFGTVDMAALVQDVFAELRASAPDRSVQLDLKNPPPLWADRTMMRQLLTNLLSNAIKFTQLRPLAIVEVGGDSDSDDGFNHYYVKDNGIGFDMKYAEKLFKVFEHVQPAGQFEGSGTGLAMVRRIVVRHGGQVWAEAEPEAGATIHFTLPNTQH
jgi:PAS domain S-box-containing protein